MMRLQQQMAVTQDEHNRISVINGAIREQLQGEQDKAFKMEESLKVLFKSYFKTSFDITLVVIVVHV